MSPPEPLSGYSIVWSDDFTGPGGTSPRQDLWEIKTQGPNRGNDEIQCYTSKASNVCLSGQDSLYIKPQKDHWGNWTSARLEGMHSFNCEAGHAMILQASLRTGTARFEEQSGIWPAFWALGQVLRYKGVPWPQCGEWDIMETAHGAPYTLATLHYGRGFGFQNNLSIGGESAQGNFVVNDFHTFALKVDRRFTDWRQEKLQWYIDGMLFFTITGSDVNDPDLWARVAHKYFFPILNVAVGGNFPKCGKPDANTTTGLGSGMQVKYVAFYKSN